MKNNKRARGSCGPHKKPNLSVPTDEQIMHITEAANATPGMQITANIITTLHHTGLRAGELARLRVSDIDDAKGTLRIVSSKYTNPRIVPLDAVAREALSTLSAQDGDSEFVLGGQGEMRMRRASIQVRELAKKLNIAPFHLHGLRRSFAMHLVKTGMSWHTICHILGHRNLLSVPHLYMGEGRTLA